MAQLIGVVLAGGEGSKTGRSRGSLVLDGLTLAERGARALRPLCASVLVSVPPGAANPVPKCPCVEDAPPARRGPLAGIDSVMRVTGNSDLLILACVYPHVPTEMLKLIVAAAAAGPDLVLPVDPAGRDHPLVGFWRRSTAKYVREALDNRIYKVRAILADLDVRRLMPAELAGFDLARILEQVEGPEDLDGSRRARPERPAPPPRTSR